MSWYGARVFFSKKVSRLGNVIEFCFLCSNLASELAPHNVTVNAYAPGLIMTDMCMCEPSHSVQTRR